MGFSLRIETSSGEALQNIHLRGELTGGSTVFAFLMGLLTYCDWDRTDDTGKSSLQHVFDWYQRLDKLMLNTLCITCQALMASIWGDGGDPTEYREDEYGFYLHRNANSGTKLSEAEFQAMVLTYDRAYQPIEDVLAGVQTLLGAFTENAIEPLEGFYVSESTIQDFEALQFNLEWLEKRSNDEVRLNFA